MADTNVAIIKGNLVRDAELTYTPGGTAILKGAIANNERFKSGEEWKDYANFFDFTIWGKRGESLEQYLKKGTGVILTGRLHQSRWEQDGNKRSRVELHVSDMSFAGGKGSGNQGHDGYDGAEGAGGNPRGSQGQASGERIDDDFPDDVPF